MVEGILGMVIEEKLEERLRTIQREETCTFTNEEIRYLDLVRGNVSLWPDLYFLRFQARPSFLYNR